MRYAVCLVFAVLVSGCMSTGLKVENGMIVRTAGETNMFRPSLSVMQVLTCHHEDGVTETLTVDEETISCSGRFVSEATVQASQAGAMTGIGGAVVQGGAIVGGAHLLGQGIGRSGTTVNQSGGGASANAQGGSANQLQGQGQGQMQGQWQGQNQWQKLNNCQGNC